MVISVMPLRTDRMSYKLVPLVGDFSAFLFLLFSRGRGLAVASQPPKEI
jgi:hypothetical protein